MSTRQQPGLGGPVQDAGKVRVASGAVAGGSSLRRRARARSEGAGPAATSTNSPCCGTSDGSPLHSPSQILAWTRRPLAEDRVQAMPVGSELLARGRRYLRLPGGRAVKVQDFVSPPTSSQKDRGSVSIALNFPNLFAFETFTDSDPIELRYGPSRAIITDLSRRGVSLVRHPGKAQLFLDALLGAGRDTDIGLDMMTDSAAIASAVARSPEMRNFLALSKMLHRNGMQTVVTLQTLGGGSTASGATWTPTGPDHDGRTLYDSPAVRWSTDFVGHEQFDPWTGQNLPFTRRDDGANNTWDTQTLDPGNAYKRLFYRKVCRAVARHLDELAATPAYAHLKEVIRGVEIGNEVEVRHVYRTSETDIESKIMAQDWGRFYAECAVAIREVNDWLPIWLPGLASYTTDGEPETEVADAFWGKVTFIRDLIERAGEHLSTIGRTDYSLVDLVAGVDVHWYHTDDTASRRAVLLPLELDAIWTAIEESFEKAGSPGHRIELTMVECGINTLCEADPKKRGKEPTPDMQCIFHAPNPAPHRRPLLASVLDSPVLGRVAIRSTREAQPLDWQAATVVIQLTMALAGGARTVGPHGHIELPPSINNPFAGHGIREDRILDMRASDAWLRPAGALLARLAALYANVDEVRLIHPSLYLDPRGAEVPLERRGTGQALNDGTWPTENFACVVELNGLWDNSHPYKLKRDRWGNMGSPPSRGPWGYLCFLDSVPGADEGDDRTPLALDITLVAAERHGSAWKIGLTPTLRHFRASSDDEFPGAFATYAPRELLDSESLYGQYTVTVARGRMPVLLVSTKQLSVGLVTVLPEFGG